MAGRVCKQCRRSAVHRTKRGPLERVWSELIGMRRDVCFECGNRQWAPLPGRSGPAWSNVAALVAVFSLGGVVLIEFADPAPSRWPSFSRASTADAAMPVPVDAASLPSVRNTAEMPAAAEVAAVESPPQSEAELVSTAGDPEPSPPVETEAEAVQVSAVAPAEPPPDPATVRRTLQAITPRWTGERMEVVVEADTLPPGPQLTYIAASRRYVLDLPGNWQLPSDLSRSRSFTRSNLMVMDVGLHPSYLRIVFGVQDQRQRPQFQIAEDEAVLLF